MSKHALVNCLQCWPDKGGEKSALKHFYEVLWVVLILLLLKSITSTQGCQVSGTRASTSAPCLVYKYCRDIGISLVLSWHSLWLSLSMARDIPTTNWSLTLTFQFCTCSTVWESPSKRTCEARAKENYCRSRVRDVYHSTMPGVIATFALHPSRSVHVKGSLIRSPQAMQLSPASAQSTSICHDSSRSKRTIAGQ